MNYIVVNEKYNGYLYHLWQEH